MNVYESAKLYNEKTKRYHDKRILVKKFEPGQLVLLFQSKLKLFPDKLKSKWRGPFRVVQVFPYGAIEVMDPRTEDTFKVNGQRRDVGRKTVNTRAIREATRT